MGLALVRIVGAMLRDEHSVLTVSTRLQGEYGLRDVCLSVPCIVSRTGAGRILEGPLAPAEQAALEASAAVIRDRLATLDHPGSARKRPPKRSRNRSRHRHP